MAVMLRYFTEFGAFGCSYVEVVKLDPYCLQQQCSEKNIGLVFGSVLFKVIFSEITEKE